MSDVRAPARCGTPSGYQKHQRNSERPCEACTRAKADYDERWRAAPLRRQKDRLTAQAQSRALRALKDRHVEEYRELYAAERDRLFAAAGLGVGSDRDEGEQ